MNTHSIPLRVLAMTSCSCLSSMVSAQCALQWSPLGPSRTDTIALIATASGDLVAAFPGPSSTSWPGGSNSTIERWNGASWSVLGTVHGGVVDLEIDSHGDLLVAGTFATVNGTTVSNLARWNGTVWSSVGGGTDAPVSIVEPLQNGDLVVGGDFTLAGGVVCNGIARWNGSSWTPLGVGLRGSAATIVELANGDLVVGGSFAQAGNVAANNIARWDGSAWHALGSGVISSGGGLVRCIVPLPNGDLLVGGSFTNAGGVPAVHLARWDGATWHAHAPGLLPHYGTFSPPLHGRVADAVRLPDGDLLIAGWFATSTGVEAVARWNGTSWEPVGGGVSGTQGPLGYQANAIASMPNGEFALGGTFGFAVPAWPQSSYANGIGMLSTTCPATAAAIGQGCGGPGGPNLLRATSLPWTGATFTSTATGMPPSGLALAVLGQRPAAVNLATVSPLAVWGCTLLVVPEAVELHLATGAALALAVTVPDSPALAGLALRQQVVVFDGSALTSSNALALQLGTF